MNENDYPNNSLILIMNNKEPKELAQTWQETQVMASVLHAKMK